MDEVVSEGEGFEGGVFAGVLEGVGVLLVGRGLQRFAGPSRFFFATPAWA